MFSRRQRWFVAAACTAGLSGGLAACSRPTGEAQLKGFASVDLVAGGEAIASDGNHDALVELRLEPGAAVTALTLHNVDGQRATWDTLPGNGFWVLGVAAEASPEVLLNEPDGSVRFEPDGRTKVRLYVADNGAVRGRETGLSVTVGRADGSLEEIGVAPE